PEKVFENSDPADHQTLREIQSKAGGFYAWGAVPGERNEPNWNSMQAGDWVLCVYDSEYRYVTRMLWKVNNETLAAAIWGRDPQKRTWQYMYYLEKPQAIQVSLDAVDSYLISGYLLPPGYRLHPILQCTQDDDFGDLCSRG